MKPSFLPFALCACTTLSAVIHPDGTVPVKGAGAGAGAARPADVAKVRKNNFLTGPPAGQTIPAAQPASRTPVQPLPACQLIIPIVPSRTKSPSRTTAPTLRTGGSAAGQRVSALNLDGKSKEESKEDASRPGHRRRQAWGPGAGAGAAAILDAGGPEASGWKVTLAPAGDEAQRTVPGGARLKEAFTVANPAGGPALDLYLAPSSQGDTAGMTVHVHSSRSDRRWSALTMATVLNRPIVAGETVSVFVEEPATILNFRLLDESGRLLETIDLVTTGDAGKPLVGSVGVGI